MTQIVAQHLVLTGFMATGKSTVGRILAERLGRKFVDTDDLIESRFGPIPEIFEQQSEAAFRQMERDVAHELAGRNGLVISTGGRFMLDDECAEALSAADVVCLTASPETIVARLGKPGERRRPLLRAEDDDAARQVGTLLAMRSPLYRRFQAVDTEGRTPEEVAEQVLAVTGHSPTAVYDQR